MRVFVAFLLGFLLKLKAILLKVFAWQRIKLFWGQIFFLFSDLQFWSNSWVCCWHSWWKFQSGGTPSLIRVFNARADDVICNHTATVKPYGPCLLVFVVEVFMLLGSCSTELHLKWCSKALSEAAGGTSCLNPTSLTQSVTEGKISTQDMSEVRCSMYLQWHRAEGKWKDTPRGKARLWGCHQSSFVEKRLKMIFSWLLFMDGFGLNKQTRIESARLKNIIYGVHFYFNNKNERCYCIKLF